ncbi:hypothetical protein F5B19DRAFT_494069 [Rostrohypoxylon terebratum]|nr:hypothetical protein F5B19DRAFT_494069 [Rostrohypoxylon terebratum]
MAMTMSTKRSKAPKSSDAATTPVAGMGTEETMEEKLHQAQSENRQSSATASSTGVLIGTMSTEEARRDKNRTKERAFNLQRIQLAEQLRNERKLSADLEARIADLQEELARLARSKEACEMECTGLRRQIDETIQQLGSQTAAGDQRDEDMSRRTIDLESKLEEVTQNLQESILNCDLVQRSHADAVRMCDEQSDKINQLERELGIKDTKSRDLGRVYGELQELYRNVVAEKKATQTALLAQVEHYKSQASRGQQMLDKATESRDKYLAESEKLRQGIKELEKSSKPFAQTIVICVDVSGSVSGVIHDIKQAYRDVLHIIKSINRGSKVAVVIHGEYSRRSPFPAQEISESTFKIMDSVPSPQGTEDYIYCLEKAHEILGAEVNGKGLVILIGDGDAKCSDVRALLRICNQFKHAEILAHSIIFPQSSGLLALNNSASVGFTVSRISATIGGVVEGKDTYLRAFDDILRRERERQSRHETNDVFAQELRNQYSRANTYTKIFPTSGQVKKVRPKSDPPTSHKLEKMSLPENDASSIDEGASSPDRERPPLLRINLSSTPDDVDVPKAPGFLPTRDVPWINENQRDMLKLLENKEALVSLALYLEKKAENSLKDGCSQKYWDIDTMKNILKGKDDMRALLHSIPRELLRSIVMGTVGWQAKLPGDDPFALRHEHDDVLDQPGTYVMTMGLMGHRGRCLSGKQYLTLSQMIDDYLDAYSALKTNPDVSLLPQQTRDKIRGACRIDEYYADFDHDCGKLAFVQDEARESDMRHLSRIYREFYERAEDKDRPLVQTINYVGSATRSMKECSANHLPNRKFANSNHCWWLTMSCIKAMGQSPDVVVVAGVRTWEPEQLPISQILVTILGRNEVEAWGFNCMAPDTAIEKSANEPNDRAFETLEAMAEKNNMNEELDKSLSMLERVSKIVTDTSQAEDKVEKTRHDLLAMLPNNSVQQNVEFDKNTVEEQIRLNNEYIKLLDEANEDVKAVLDLFEYFDDDEDDEDDGKEGRMQEQ